MKYLGAHVSTNGGLHNAPTNAAEIGANAFALFTKNQRQWIAKPLTDSEISTFRQTCEMHNFDLSNILPHDSYILNLGSADDELLQKSRASFTDELRRCQRLGLTMLNFHPGSAKNWPDTQPCLDVIAESVQMAIDDTENVMAVIENTAGQGSYVGHSFVQLKYLIDKINRPGRVGICIDTCHMFAAGYDIADEYAYEQTWNEFGQVVGFQHLVAMHLNDSMKPLGSKVDRHMPLGKGYIGIDAFARIMQDERMNNIPLILETPEPDLWKAEIELLRSFEK